MGDGVTAQRRRDSREGAHVRVGSSAFVEICRRSADGGATARPAVVSGSGLCFGTGTGLIRQAPGVNGRLCTAAMLLLAVPLFTLEADAAEALAGTVEALAATAALPRAAEASGAPAPSVW